MKYYAADYRREARHALKGNWPKAVLAMFIATCTGATVSSTLYTSKYEQLKETVDLSENYYLGIGTHNLLFYLLIALVIELIISITIGGAIQLGYAKFNIHLVERKAVSVGEMFSQMHRLWAGFCLKFLTFLYTFLWSLLFYIPGIIKGLSYSMAPYILAESPELTANEAISESGRLMMGNKWRLFCLSISFIGWTLLCALPTILLTQVATFAVLITGNYNAVAWAIPGFLLSAIGSFFLGTYQEAAVAAFYRDIAWYKNNSPETIPEIPDAETTFKWPD